MSKEVLEFFHAAGVLILEGYGLTEAPMSSFNRRDNYRFGTVGAAVPGMDIKIADEIGERSYHLYSGGEAFRTNFALRLALSKVLARRAGTSLRSLIIDEGFGTQDSQGLEQLIEAIQEISRDFDKVLVVTHLAELKNAFPVQIEVTKHPETGSRFEVVQNG